MEFKLCNNTLGEENYEIKGDFEIVSHTFPYTDFDGNTQYYTDYFVKLNTLEDLMKFIELNGTIYMHANNTIGYGNFYIE
jgi:hypothetical protein